MTNVFRLFSETYKRARHSFGFGVQSPFAFRIVNLLRLRRSEGFYADAELSEMALREGGAHLRRQALRFHRLCALFPSGRVFISPSASSVMTRAAHLASSHFEIEGKAQPLSEIDLAYLMSRDFSMERLKNELGNKYRMIMFHGYDEGEMKNLGRLLNASLLLSGKNVAVFLRREKMASVGYTIWL